MHLNLLPHQELHLNRAAVTGLPARLMILLGAWQVIRSAVLHVCTAMHMTMHMTMHMSTQRVRFVFL